MPDHVRRAARRGRCRSAVDILIEQLTADRRHDTAAHRDLACVTESAPAQQHERRPVDAMTLLDPDREAGFEQSLFEQVRAEKRRAIAGGGIFRTPCASKKNRADRSLRGSSVSRQNRYTSGGNPGPPAARRRSDRAGCGARRRACATARSSLKCPRRPVRREHRDRGRRVTGRVQRPSSRDRTSGQAIPAAR